MMTDFTKTRAAFHLPDGMTYLDGNSLGPMPRAAANRVATMMADEWSQMLITGWNRAGWYVQPRKVGDRIARLIGRGRGRHRRGAEQGGCGGGVHLHLDRRRRVPGMDGGQDPAGRRSTGSRQALSERRAGGGAPQPPVCAALAPS